MSTAHTYRLSAYPKETSLRDGTSVTLKPMTTEDGDSLLQFFLRVPEEDRYYLKEDVTSPKVIERWAQELDYDRALPLLAWVDGRVVADASLHRTRTVAHRHVGEVRLVVDPEFRNRGLGTALMHEVAEIAYANDLERLLLQAVVDREDQAIQAAEYLGFSRVGVLPQYAKDPDGTPHDVVMLDLPLGRWITWVPF